MSNQHKIEFLETKEDSKISKKSSSKGKKTIEQIAEEQKAKKLSNKDDGLMTSKNIRSAKCGNIKDEGGPTKFTKSESSNTIFDTDKSARQAQEIDSKTRVKNEKEAIATNRREAEQKRMDTLVDSLKKTEQAKDSSVSRLSDLGGSKYYSPKNNISIFDTKEFERLADKTAGEKESEIVKQKKSQVDNSWKSDGKQTTSRDVTNRFFDNLLNNLGE
jgi:hypothetical protein